jgi:hypothetical protein
MNITETIPIDIIDDILKRPEALDTYLGAEVSQYLLSKTSVISKPTLFKIDLRKANPIDYLFTKTGFTEFFTEINNSKILDAVFIVNQSQIEPLLVGLLAGGDIDIGIDYEETFKSSFNIKISTNGAAPVYIGSLNDHETKILNHINASSCIEEKEIYSEFNSEFSHELIADAIKSLKTKSFIYVDDQTVPFKIISINTKF